MLHILLVDDDALNVDVMTRYLEREADRESSEHLFQVQGATTPEQAIAVASEPGSIFDLFLIDVNLNAEMDGIALMQELRTRHPDSDVIVFTGYDDWETGQQAFELGAYRYLPLPVKPQELALILRRLDQQRRILRERDWHQLLANVAEESQAAISKQEVAEVIVRGGRRLGFQRARLWWAVDDGSELRLASAAGSPALTALPPIQLPLADSVYAQEILRAPEAAFFWGSTKGPTDLERILGSECFQTPVGEWAGVALRSGDRLLAVLLLDNAEQPQRYSSEQRALINLFGRQAAVAIEKARFVELEQQKSKELALLHQIGKRITSQAADDLDTLLLDLRMQIGQFLDVTNFMIVLKDDEIQRLDFRLQYEGGRPRPRRWLPLDHGLVGHLIAANRSVFLPHGTGEYLKAHGLRRQGRPARTWLGVPLRVAEKPIGALAVQSYKAYNAFSREQVHLLDAIADTIAGAIRVAWAHEKEADAARRLAVLQRFSAEFMALAEESEKAFWHAVLTAATADYGLRFNRAMLFMRDRSSSELRGVMGIGDFDDNVARIHWRRDRVRALDYAEYLQIKRSGRIRVTPVEEKVKSMTLQADFAGSRLYEVLQTAQRSVVAAEDMAASMPPEYVAAFGAGECAIFPLKGHNHVRGLVIVDNRQNGYRLASEYLDQLETLLTLAMLVFQNVRQRRMREVILDTNYAVVSQAAHTPLQTTLQRICEAASGVTEADSVVIYPLGEGRRYDRKALVATGLKAGKAAGDKPRQRGVTAHILNRGILIVPDVEASTLTFGNRPLREHAFIQREGVRAFLGIRIKDAVSGELIGALYLNYGQRRAFDERDRRVAEMFAGLAATAIRTTRVAESNRADLAEATHQGEASRQELQILQLVLGESLMADTSEEKLIPVVLRAAHRLLDRSDMQIALLLRAWAPPSGGHTEPSEVQNQYYLSPGGELMTHLEPEVYRGISGQAMRTGEILLVNDLEQDQRGRQYYNRDGAHFAELDVPIQSGRNVFAVLNAEAPHKNAFSENDRIRLDRLAKVSALAFDNVRRQLHLRTLLETVTAMTSPTGLPETLEAIAQAARKVAPSLSAFTLWYIDPEDNRIRQGAWFGVNHPELLRPGHPKPESVIAAVMGQQEPIWAVDAAAEPRLGTTFVLLEEIRSCAAFPLRVGETEIGVMFFNYRARHEFTKEEEAIFTLLAEIAAVSLQDAVLLHVAEQEKERLRHSLEITDAVGTTLRLHETLTRIMEELRKIFPSAAPCVMLYNQDDHALEFAQASLDFYKIDNPAYATVSSLPLEGPGLSVRTAQASLAQSEPIADIYPSTHGIPHYLPLIRGTQSQMNVGLMNRDRRLLGVLVLESSRENAFSEDNRALVKGIAQQISIAIDRAAESANLRFKTTVASRTSWAAEMAHDANKEISYIRNRAYWIIEQAATLDVIHQYAREIDDSAERLAYTIQNDLETRDKGEQPFVLANAMQEWLREMVTDHFPDIHVAFSCDCEGAAIHTQQEMLRRTVRHVLRNAVEAMQRKGTVTCSVHKTPAEEFEIRIGDTGPGIAEENRQILGREPFSTKGGTRGYGLLLVRSILEDMGGSLRVMRSKPGEGATLILRVPAKSEKIVQEGLAAGV